MEKWWRTTTATAAAGSQPARSPSRLVVVVRKSSSSSCRGVDYLESVHMNIYQLICANPSSHKFNQNPPGGASSSSILSSSLCYDQVSLHCWLAGKDAHLHTRPQSSGEGFILNLLFSDFIRLLWLMSGRDIDNWLYPLPQELIGQSSVQSSSPKFIEFSIK